MAKSRHWKDHGYDILNNIYATPLVGLMVMIGSGLYTHYGAEWAKPIVNAIVSGSLFFALVFCLRALLAFPLASRRITPENVGPIVLDWLHKFELGVKVKHFPEHDFHYIVTTEGEKTINIKRHLLQNPDYIKVLGKVTLTDSQKEFIETMTENQKVDALVAIQQEFLRARVGYSTVNVLTDGFLMFQNVPIRANLNEKELLDAVWNIEAMISLVLTNNSIVERDIRAQRGESGGEPIPRRSGGIIEV